MKVLIVDDELPSRELLAHILKPHGVCTQAQDGEEAVALFKEALQAGNPFDLVFLDIMMPRMDGQQALKEIRMAEKQVYGPTLTTKSRDVAGYAHVIMITSMDDPSQLMEAFTRGKCNGYLTKPVVITDLMEKLKKNNMIK